MENLKNHPTQTFHKMPIQRKIMELHIFTDKKEVPFNTISNTPSKVTIDPGATKWFHIPDIAQHFYEKYIKNEPLL